MASDVCAKAELNCSGSKLEVFVLDKCNPQWAHLLLVETVLAIPNRQPLVTVQLSTYFRKLQSNRV